MSQETPLQFGLRVARTWYSGGHGDLAHLIAREVERREAAPATPLPPAVRVSELDHPKDVSAADATERR